ncbi:MAG: DNA internalization-related competence protein ComEC/Rec2 [Pseudomonadales bacterium]|nr:DNA internalization-related competence protein ComEC/Rec2 [Pseudomonadales bacterium]
MKNLRGIFGVLHRQERSGSDVAVNFKKTALHVRNQPLLILFALISGIAVVACFPALPEQQITTPIAFLLIALLYYKRFLTAATFLAGLFWALLYGWSGQANQLDPIYEGRDLWLTGTVSSIPLSREISTHASYQRFEVSTVSLRLVDNSQTISAAPVTMPKKIRVSWYGGEPVQAGELWRWRVRLKSPRGFSNPSGFDYEGWLFQHRIGATGYIKKSPENKLLERFQYAESIPWFRSSISKTINELIGDFKYSGLVLALINGDRSNLDRSQWNTLLDTGTNHLMVISGLHIGLIAVFAYRLIGFLLCQIRLIQRPSIGRFLNIPDPMAVQCWAAIVVAGLYTAVAGFSLSTQRAFVMVVVVMIAQLLGRNIKPFNSILLALAAVLLLDPLAVISAGFWLSFAAVGSLLYVFANRYPADDGGLTRLWNQWGLAQWAIFIALMPILGVLLLNVSLVSPFANLVAVPVVSLLIVPLCLAGAILAPFFEIPAFQLLTVANWLFEWLWLYLEWLTSMVDTNWYPGGISGRGVFLALIGVILLLAPRGFPGRGIGVVCLFPFLISSPNSIGENEVELAILDVGQGLAVNIQTSNHSLLYDTGPQFSSAFDAGSAVIVPYLRDKGISTLDLLILSHGDIDHVGGTAAVLDKITVESALLGSSNKHIATLINSLPKQTTACIAGMSWQWDGIEFDILYPSVLNDQRENNRSCVLMVNSGTVRILLTGDIEASAEKELIKQYGKALKADILIVPHHGSRTSSTQAFIELVSPQQVIFSSGYKNRFHHPNTRVVDRYRANNSEMINTANAGAVVYYFKTSSEIIGTDQLADRTLSRQENRRYWHRD